jgi:hypothetical protein
MLKGFDKMAMWMIIDLFVQGKRNDREMAEK